MRNPDDKFSDLATNLRRRAARPVTFEIDAPKTSQFEDIDRGVADIVQKLVWEREQTALQPGIDPEGERNSEEEGR